MSASLLRLVFHLIALLLLSAPIPRISSAFGTQKIQNEAKNTAIKVNQWHTAAWAHCISSCRRWLGDQAGMVQSVTWLGSHAVLLYACFALTPCNEVSPVSVIQWAKPRASPALFFLRHLNKHLTVLDNFPLSPLPTYKMSCIMNYLGAGTTVKFLCLTL